MEAEAAEHGGEETVGDAKVERLYSRETLKG